MGCHKECQESVRAIRLNNMNVICAICLKSFNNVNGLAKHIYSSHKDIKKEDYYNKYIKKVSYVCKCGKKKRFRSLGEGYRTYCSSECGHKYGKKYSPKGTKQSQETIRKRINNTDQKQRQENHKQALMKKYGVTNPYNISSVRNKKRIYKYKRTPEHQQKIVEAKLKNGTSKHTQETKNKIRKKVKATLSDPNFDKSVFLSKPKGNNTGYINGIYYRSSYEKRFINICIKNDISIESAENNKFAIRYIDIDGKARTYFPDFYLPKYDIVVEVKPLSMLDIGNNQIKIDKLVGTYSAWLVTEEELTEMESGEYIYPWI